MWRKTKTKAHLFPLTYTDLCGMHIQKKKKREKLGLYSELIQSSKQRSGVFANAQFSI